MPNMLFTFVYNAALLIVKRFKPETSAGAPMHMNTSYVEAIVLSSVSSPLGVAKEVMASINRDLILAFFQNE